MKRRRKENKTKIKRRVQTREGEGQRKEDIGRGLQRKEGERKNKRTKGRGEGKEKYRQKAQIGRRNRERETNEQRHSERNKQEGWGRK